MGLTKIIIGLGNPGKKYEGTRHNAGFEVIDRLGEHFCCDVGKKKFGGIMGECEYDGKKLILFKPMGYMNCSGQPSATITGFYKVGIEDVLVITDDMALEPGDIRIKGKGSAGGHNGLADIIEKFGSNRFGRLRIGVGKSPYPDWKDYVLGRPGSEDAELLKAAYGRSVQAVECWVKDGIDMTMNKFNVRMDKQSDAKEDSENNVER